MKYVTKPDESSRPEDRLVHNIYCMIFAGMFDKIISNTQRTIEVEGYVCASGCVFLCIHFLSIHLLLCH